MKKLYPQSVGNILKNKNLFTNSLTEQTQILQQLTNILQNILPEPLAQHCKVANIHHHSKTIVLAASSPVWSSRLRFHSPRILKTLQQDYQLPFYRSRILVSKVEPEDVGRVYPVGIPPLGNAPQPTLSQNSVKLVQKTAQTIENSELRDSLLRLFKRTHNS